MANRRYNPILVAFALTSLSHGAITWQTPQNITNDSDVSLNGESVHAYTFTDNNVGLTHMVNTVGFVRTDSTSVAGSYSLATAGPSDGLSIGATNFNATPYSTTTADYRAILAAAMRTTGGTAGGPNPAVGNDNYYNAITLTLQGLVSGQSYEIQLWFNDSRNVSTAYEGFGHLTDGAAGDDPTGPLVDYNIGNVTAGGGLGQYVIGTFVAGGATESFTFTTKAAEINNVALINAYQLRLIPEPSSALLAAAGMFAGITRRRR